MASAGGYIQAALEQAPNAEGGANAVSSNVFYLPGTQIDMDPKPTMLERKDELRGEFAALPHSGVAKYEPEGSLESRIYPATLGLLLHPAIGTCVTTAGDASAVTDPDSVAVPIGAHRHVYGWKTSEIPQTMQLQYAPPSGVPFKKSQGVAVDELAFKAGDGAWTLTAKLLALVDAVIADPSLTPSYETAGPWREGELALTWLSGSATTKEFEFAIKNGLKTERQFTTASRYPDSIVYEANLPVVGGSIPKRSFDVDDWNALIAGTTFAATLKFVHSETVKRPAVNITSSSVANPTVITCAAPHNLPAGTSSVVIAGHTGSTPAIAGTYTATMINATTFSIPVNVSGGGTGGTVISDTGYEHSLWITLPACQLVEGKQDAVKNERRTEASWSWEARYDTVTSKWADIVLVNGTAAYASY